MFLHVFGSSVSSTNLPWFYINMKATHFTSVIWHEKGFSLKKNTRRRTWFYQSGTDWIVKKKSVAYQHEVRWLNARGWKQEGFVTSSEKEICFRGWASYYILMKNITKINILFSGKTPTDGSRTMTQRTYVTKVNGVSFDLLPSTYNFLSPTYFFYSIIGFWMR